MKPASGEDISVSPWDSPSRVSAAGMVGAKSEPPDSSPAVDHTAQEWRGKVIMLRLPEAAYGIGNRVVKQAIREALEQKFRANLSKVSMSKVQAYVLEALGVNFSKEELHPIADFCSTRLLTSATSMQPTRAVNE